MRTPFSVSLLSLRTTVSLRLLEGLQCPLRLVAPFLPFFSMDFLRSRVALNQKLPMCTYFDTERMGQFVDWIDYKAITHLLPKDWQVRRLSDLAALPGNESSRDVMRVECLLTSYCRAAGLENLCSFGSPERHRLSGLVAG